MNQTAVIDELYAARSQAGPTTTGIPEDLDVPAALALQLQVADRFRLDNDPIGGWKVGLTSRAARNRLGIGVRPFGFVPMSRVIHSGQKVDLDDSPAHMLEPEICLVLGEDLAGADIDATAARRAVRAVAAAFEIVEVRVPLGGSGGIGGLLLADGLANWGIVVGEQVPVATFEPAATAVSLWHDDEQFGKTIVADRDLIDDPFESLAALARSLAVHGRSLSAGQVVITGSLLHAPIDGPGEWKATFTGVGDVSITIS